MLTRRISARNPQELAEVSLRTPAGPRMLTNSEYRELEKGARSLSGVAAYTLSRYRITGQGRPEVASAFLTTRNFFSVFGQPLLAGRGFSEGNDVAGEAVLSYGLWMRRFNGDPGVIGKPLVLYSGAIRTAHTIVGVAPREFRPMPVRSFDVVLPIPEGLKSDAPLLTLWCRKKPGVSLDQARAELEVAGKQLAPVFPESFGKAKLAFDPAVRQGPVITTMRTIIQAIVGLVLLIACANVTNLLLARHEARRAEMATRLALGATRGRLLRQLLIESLLLALPAAVAGFGFAVLTLRVVETIRIPGMDWVSLYFHLDGTVFAFALCAGLAAAILAGLWPARAASRTDLAPALKGVGAALARRKFGIRGALVAGQLAVSVVGIAATMMLVKGVWTLVTFDPGVDPQRVLVASMSPAMSGYTDARAIEFKRRLAASLEQPGVQAVSFAMFPPGGEEGRREEVVNPTSAARQDVLRVQSNSVSPGFFRAFGIQVLNGREYGEGDLTGRPVCIVNQAMARRFWSNRNPLGQTVRTAGARPVDYEVIGVTRDTEYERMGNEYVPFLYLPLTRAEHFSVFLRTEGRADAYADTVRRAVAALDPDMPVLRAGVLADRLTGFGNGVEMRLRAGMLGSLSGAAMLLSALGLYGVVSYLVTRRTREIGIRLALGAGRAQVLAAVLHDGARLAAVGLGIGVALSMIVNPLLASRLFGVTPRDPLVIGGTCALLAAVAAAAMLIPARRACRVKAMAALRWE